MACLRPSYWETVLLSMLRQSAVKLVLPSMLRQSAVELALPSMFKTECYKIGSSKLVYYWDTHSYGCGVMFQTYRVTNGRITRHVQDMQSFKKAGCTTHVNDIRS